jgi:hypothetical protein
MTSKLQHYLYPFLPPLAILGGIGLAQLLNLRGRMVTVVTRRTVRGIALGVVGLSLVVAVWTWIAGRAVIQWNHIILFRNSSVARPLVIGAVATLAVIRKRWVLFALLLAPILGNYVATVDGMRSRSGTFTELEACVQEVGPDARVRALFDRNRAAGHSYSFYDVAEYVGPKDTRLEQWVFGDMPCPVWLPPEQYRARVAGDTPESRRWQSIEALLLPPAKIHGSAGEAETAVLLLPGKFAAWRTRLLRAGAKRVDRMEFVPDSTRQ